MGETGPSEHWLSTLRYIAQSTGLLGGLPGGAGPLFSANDARLDDLLTETSVDDSALKTLISGRRSYKVGPTFEALAQYLLTAGLGYECLAWDLQIFELKRTVGALDLVLRSTTGAVEHWELAYKLYLHDGVGLSSEHWVGPNEHDRLRRKVDRLLNHQLPLSSRAEAESALRKIGVERIDSKRILLLGLLFHHWRQSPQRAEGAMADSFGVWVHIGDLPAFLAAHCKCHFSQRHKPFWFGPWGPHQVPVQGEDVRRHFRARPLSRPQLWITHSDTDIPFFVVPNTWGQRTR